jgi:hypothetical protein
MNDDSRAPMNDAEIDEVEQYLYEGATPRYKDWVSRLVAEVRRLRVAERLAEAADAKERHSIDWESLCLYPPEVDKKQRDVWADYKARLEAWRAARSGGTTGGNNG